MSKLGCSTLRKPNQGCRIVSVRLYLFSFFLFHVYLLFADRKLKERVDKSIATEAFVLQQLLLTVSTVFLRSRQKIFSSWLLTHLTGGVDLYFVLVFHTRLCRKVPKLFDIN